MVENKITGEPGAQETKDETKAQLLQTIELAMIGNQDALKALMRMGHDGVKGIFIDDHSDPGSVDVLFDEGDDGSSS